MQDDEGKWRNNMRQLKRVDSIWRWLECDSKGVKNGFKVLKLGEEANFSFFTQMEVLVLRKCEFRFSHA